VAICFYILDEKRIEQNN